MSEHFGYFQQQGKVAKIQLCGEIFRFCKSTKLLFTLESCFTLIIYGMLGYILTGQSQVQAKWVKAKVGNLQLC